MKTYSERVTDVQKKIRIHKRNKRIITGSCLMLSVAILALVLFLPYQTMPPDVSRYQSSEYYGLICKLNELTFVKPRYTNRFEYLVDHVRLPGFKGGTAAPGDAPTSDLMNSAAGEYVEVTDNQVQGVTESDIIKRSDKYIYYLTGSNLDIYSIDGENSKLVGNHEICEFDFPEDYKQTGWGWSADNVEMYLSKDCTTITVVLDYIDDELGSCVLIVNLDVTDPADVQTAGYVFLPGNIISTRMAEGQLLLTYNYRVKADSIDYAVPETYVPTYGKPGSMQTLPAQNIVCPETADAARYTVVCSLDSRTLEVRGSVALLGYSQQLYVSRDTLYATHSYGGQTEKNLDGHFTYTAMTEITGISYADGKLSVLGSVQLDGSVKDQYSMDQYDGILRVVTTTSEQERKEYSNQIHSGVAIFSSRQNVNLYCVDLSDWSVAASVVGFAPEGEEATSVRFDGVNAYVCTAEIITLTDPVYFFDLSDLNNITWTDTGTITGYSTSLINIGEGYLLGIGYGDARQLKIEVYEQTQTGVASVCAWQIDATFSEQYKSYFIDRENNLVGLAMRDYWSGGRYVLLQFDGYELQTVLQVPLDEYTAPGTARAFLADGYFYILEASNGLLVQKVR